MQDTRTLMNDVFEALYNQDAQVLGEIIKSYGYKIDLEEEDTDSKIENKGTEEDKTEDYGKKYIENIVQNKDSQKALEITELFRMNQLIPDGEETVVALSKTNFEQLIDTIMTEVGAEKVFKELTKENNFKEILLQMISTNGLTKVEDEISSYFEKEYGEPKYKKISNVLVLDLTNAKLAIETVLNNEALKNEIKKQAKKSLKREVKNLQEELQTLKKEMPQIRIIGGDDKTYAKFDDLVEFKDFDYEKEMRAAWVDEIGVVVNGKTKFKIKAKRKV